MLMSTVTFALFLCLELWPVAAPARSALYEKTTDPLPAGEWIRGVGGNVSYNEIKGKYLFNTNYGVFNSRDG